MELDLLCGRAFDYIGKIDLVKIGQLWLPVEGLVSKECCNKGVKFCSGQGARGCVCECPLALGEQEPLGQQGRIQDFGRGGG